MTKEEYKEFILSKIRQEEIDYTKTIDELRRKNEEARTVFLAITKADLLKERDESPSQYFEFLLNICKAVALFPDSEINKKLKSLSISKKITRWFIPLNKIEENLNLIDKKRVFVLKNTALISTYLFLTSKIRATLYEQIPFVVNIKAEPAADIIKVRNKIFKRREYSKGEPLSINDPLEFIINDLASILENEYKSRKKAKAELGKFIEGKTEETLLKSLLYSFIPKIQLEQTDFLSRLARIFILISKDRIIWTKRIYEDRESSYKNNYKRYVALRIKKMTNYNPSTDDFRQFPVHSIFNDK